MDKAIEVRNLKRVYRRLREPPFVAVDNMNFDVYEGEIFGLLGPNGAGKTTVIKILSTLLYPTEGFVRVGGFDVYRDVESIRSIINLVTGGEVAGYGILTVKESLWMFSQFYGIETKEALRRIEKYLKIVDMWDSRDTFLNKLSTGMVQRINLVRGLITDPKILFLDEPTLGLDVEGGRIVREIIKTWIGEREGRTVLLTTHYMAEADELCDRIAIINRGKLVACDTPENLKASISQDKYFEITVPYSKDLREEFLTNINGKVSIRDFPENGESLISLSLGEDKEIANFITILTQRGLEIKTFRKVEPTLEDVFIKLVGRKFEDEEAR